MNPGGAALERAHRRVRYPRTGVQAQDPTPIEPAKPGALRLGTLPRVLGRIGAGLALVWMLALVAWPERHTSFSVFRDRCGGTMIYVRSGPAINLRQLPEIRADEVRRSPGRTFVFRDDSVDVLLDGLFG